MNMTTQPEGITELQAALKYLKNNNRYISEYSVSTQLGNEKALSIFRKEVIEPWWKKNVENDTWSTILKTHAYTTIVSGVMIGNLPDDERRFEIYRREVLEREQTPTLVGKSAEEWLEETFDLESGFQMRPEIIKVYAERMRDFTTQSVEDFKRAVVEKLTVFLKTEPEDTNDSCNGAINWTIEECIEIITNHKPK